MNSKETKTIIDEIKKNPVVDFEELKKIQAKLETFKNNVHSKNEIDALKEAREFYQKIGAAAPGLKSMLAPNVQAMNILLEQLNKKND